MSPQSGDRRGIPAALSVNRSKKSADWGGYRFPPMPRRTGPSDTAGAERVDGGKGGLTGVTRPTTGACAVPPTTFSCPPGVRSRTANSSVLTSSWTVATDTPNSAAICRRLAPPAVARSTCSRRRAIRSSSPSRIPGRRRVQRGEHLGFTLEADQAVGIGRERLRQHLEGHVPVELGVVGLPDFTHPALANQADHFVRSDLRAFAQGHRVRLSVFIPPSPILNR